MQHEQFLAARQIVLAGVPNKWRLGQISRESLDRFVFEPEDVIVVLGQDGLVANVAKYLTGQLVVGINPDRKSYDGLLVSHAPEATRSLLNGAVAGEVNVRARTMVEATLDDGQRLIALNEIFVGHKTHQSARYRLTFKGRVERQSSSGVIVATSTGATGWALSISQSRGATSPLPPPASPNLCFFVREAFPSVSTGTAITAGQLDPSDELNVVSELESDGVIFGDGIESDHLAFGWGMHLSIRAAQQHLNLVAA
jgi:hypothetical protein